MSPTHCSLRLSGEGNEQKTKNAIEVITDEQKPTAVLACHVLLSKVMAADVVEPSSATTVEGRNVTVDARNGNGVKVNGARVVSADIAASNGVIHIIDEVLIPS